MKKILLLTGVLTNLFFLAGCGNKENESNSDSNQTNTVQRIKDDEVIYGEDGNQYGIPKGEAPGAGNGTVIEENPDKNE